MHSSVARPDRASVCSTVNLAVYLLVLTCVSACSASAVGRSRAVRLRPAEAGHARAGDGSLESYIGRVRALASQARPRPNLTALTVESWDPRLSAALIGLTAEPTAAQHRRVAFEYRRLGILDQAHAHLTAAVRLDAGDAAAFDGLARIWRDWGFPELGLPDAYRAVHLAPTSAAAANTLGTLLQAAGRTRDASHWYGRALELNPDAAYAANNVCYASIVTRQEGAVATCERAVALAPQSKGARNNLALAYAAAGSFERARKELERSSDAAVAQYNVGILYLADRQFPKAIAAFDAALQLNPRFDLALARAQQARAADRIEDEGRHLGTQGPKHLNED